MNDLSTMLEGWTDVTGALKPGVQRVFKDTFDLAAAGETTLIYGADYRDGSPCLVNTVGTMLTNGGGQGVPSAHFGEIVSLFDRINRELESSGVNERHGYVSPLAAEVFVRNFAPLKDMPVKPIQDQNVSNTLPYYEPTDEEMAQDMVSLLRGDTPPCGEVNYVSDRESMDFMAVVKPEARAEVSEPPC
jgi:hypothetical protein